MEVDQGVTTVDQHVSDILVDQLVSYFFRLGKGDKANFILGILGQVLELDLWNELSEVFVLGERLLYLLFLKQKEFDWDLAGLVGVGVVRETNWDVNSQNILTCLDLFHDQSR